jgi:hypothetical protein
MHLRNMIQVTLLRQMLYLRSALSSVHQCGKWKTRQRRFT